MSIHVCKCVFNGREEFHLRYPGMTKEAAHELADKINAGNLAQQAVPEGWKLAAVSDGDIRVYGPDKETWLIRKDCGEGFYDFIYRFFEAMLAAAPAAPQAEQQAGQGPAPRDVAEKMSRALADFMDAWGANGNKWSFGAGFAIAESAIAALDAYKGISVKDTVTAQVQVLENCLRDFAAIAIEEESELLPTDELIDALIKASTPESPIGRMRDALAAQQAEREPQWQPIEAAPRGSGESGPDNVNDPGYVEPPTLLLWTQEGPRVGYYDWYYHPGYGRGADPHESPWRCAEGGQAYGPTHWMPLPSAPGAHGIGHHVPGQGSKQ